MITLLNYQILLTNYLLKHPSHASYKGQGCTAWRNIWSVRAGGKGRYRKDKMLMYFSSNTLNYRLRYHLLVLVISYCILYDDLWTKEENVYIFLPWLLNLHMLYILFELRLWSPLKQWSKYALSTFYILNTQQLNLSKVSAANLT